MGKSFSAVKISEKVYWVGAIHWDLQDFHGYLTDKGTTYNAYLILDEQPVLIDTVKAQFYDEMMSRIRSVIDPSKIKTIVSNHSEMDHSGALPYAIMDIKPQKIIASVMGKQALEEHFHHNWNVTAVKDGEAVPIGKDKLVFVESRMLHWPDSMVCLLEKENILFSNDIFGMHYAHGARFDDETPGWLYQAKKYYANIVMPYGNVVKAFAEKVAKLKINPRIIAPDHGPIWRKDVSKIIGLYKEWAERKPANKAVIAFDTMWGSTALLARAAAEGLSAEGIDTRVMSLKSCHRSDIVTELLDAGLFAVGSPTMNQQMYPSVADMLTYVKGLSPKGLIGNAFGSYGWAPAGVNNVLKELKDMKAEIAGDTLSCKYVPRSEDLEKAVKLGRDMAEAFKRCQ